MKKLEYITVLRAIAILSVLVVHVKQQTDGTQFLHPYLLAVMDNGSRGVQLFYVLSAFTLFLSFHYRTTKETTPTKNYIIRRFFRIAPLYYLAIFYYLWQDGFGPRYWLGDATHISLANILSNVTFLHGFSPYWISSLVPGGWSVAIEVIFYCFLPFLFARIKNIQQALYFTLICLGLRLLLLMLFEHFILIPDERLWHEYLFLYLPNQLPVFSLGIVLYFLIYDKTNLTINGKLLLLISSVLILGLCVQRDKILSDIFYFGLACLVLVLALRKYQPVILFNRVFIFIGNISYTLYLTHWAAIHFVTKFKFINLLLVKSEPLAFANFFLNYFMILLVAVSFSTILYYLIELPMQKVGSRIIKKPA